METQAEKKEIKDLKPTDLVKTCKCIEGGVWFSIDGVYCCCASTIHSPRMISVEEMNNGKADYNLIVERRKELFGALNGLNDKDAGDCKNCAIVKTVPYEEVSFEYLGGHNNIACCFNVTHYSICNLRCKYCAHTVSNNFVPPAYNNLIQFIDEFKKRDKILPGNWITYSGGEPTLLDNFEEMLNYFLNEDIGQVCVFSNAVKFSPVIFEGLKSNKIFLTTSIDAGTSSTFKKLRGADSYHKVIENLIRYKNSGTDNLWLKYIICEDNRNEDDLLGFVMSMTAINPGKVYICPDFPYGDREIPEETIQFGAKMWYLLEKYAGITPYVQTDDVTADLKFVKFSKDIRDAYKKMKEKSNFENEWNLHYNKVANSCNDTTLNELQEYYLNSINRPTFIQQFFSVKNEGNHKVLRILGIKAKFRRGNQK